MVSPKILCLSVLMFDRHRQWVGRILGLFHKEDVWRRGGRVKERDAPLESADLRYRSCSPVEQNELSGKARKIPRCFCWGLFQGLMMPCSTACRKGWDLWLKEFEISI